MKNLEETFEWITAILAPRKLSNVEEIVFRMTLMGKSYREMAGETGYDAGYLKDIGSQLWLSLSQELGCAVTKKNLPLILTQFSKEENPSTPPPRDPRYKNPTWKKLHFPGYPLPFNSRLYIERPPVETLAFNALNQPGSLTRIKAPKYMGKTSLIYQMMGIACQNGIKSVRVDMQQANKASLNDLETFLRWFCQSVTQQLQLNPNFEDFWFDGQEGKLSCTVYMQEYLLNVVKEPLVIAIDKAHYLFNYPDLASDFFSMLRAWYEYGRVRQRWQKLRLIISHTSDLTLYLPPNQSPFNIGLSLKLPSFTLPQMGDLVKRYELSKLGIQNLFSLEPLFDLVEGHPYLLQLAFYWLCSGYLSLRQLLEQASTTEGIYQEHLYHLWLTLKKNKLLQGKFTQVLSSNKPITLDLDSAYRLEALGLVKLQGLQASPRCELYKQYFSSVNNEQDE